MQFHPPGPRVSLIAACLGWVGFVTLVGACAVSDPADLTPETNATVPEADAGPSVSMPPSSSSSSGSSGSSSGSSGDPQDAGSDAGASKDAGATKDAGGPAKDAGVVAPGSKPVQGEVLLTEVMYDPSGAEPKAEWIEVHNTAASARTLSGLTLVDGANRTHVIGANVTLAAGAYAVLARDRNTAIAQKVPAAVILYEYATGLADGAGVQLSNGASGGLQLKDGGAIIAQAAYGGWFASASGASVQLKVMTYASGTQASGWCVSTTSWAAGSDKGTPGAPQNCP